jgi:hypothetical protein
LLLCVVCFACISTNMLFYVISYDTPPLVSGAVISANAAKNFLLPFIFGCGQAVTRLNRKNDGPSYVP